MYKEVLQTIQLQLHFVKKKNKHSQVSIQIFREDSAKKMIAEKQNNVR